MLAKINKLAPPARYAEAISTALRKPIPRLSEGAILASLGFVECAIDNPRGLANSLRELAQANPSIDFHLDFSDVQIHPAVAEIAKAVEFDVRRLQMAWGDWQLVCTCNQSRVIEVLSALSHLGCPVSSAGWTSEGNGQVWYHDESGTAPLLGLTAEQFTPESYFAQSVYEYSSVLRRTPLGAASEKKG